MEPFGILQFLQSLLPKPDPQNTQNPQTQPLSEQTAQQPSVPEQAPAIKNTDAQEAYLRFLQAHEHRANRTKR